jgi:TPR repeat protein
MNKYNQALAAIFFGLILMINLATPVAAGTFEDAMGAYSVGDYTTTLRLLNPLAEKGDARALEQIGEMYAIGAGVPQDYSEAIKWLILARHQSPTDSLKAKAFQALGQISRRDLKAYFQGWDEAIQKLRLAADHGDVNAESFIGSMYHYGTDDSPYYYGPHFPKDYAKAVKLLSHSASRGNAQAQQELALMYFGKNMDECVKWLRLAAAQGLARSQSMLGMLYTVGFGVPQDLREGIEWLSLAAYQGEAQGQYLLGQQYMKGEGVPQNYAEAKKWFQLAADQGNSDGQEALGFLYARGEGVPQNYVEAYKWFSLSAAQGDKRAMTKREAMKTLS